MNHRLELKQLGLSGRLQPISLTIEAGERVVLLGASGAGKTTLLKLCNGSLQADAGTCLWDDVLLRRLGRHQRRSIGTLWQDLRLVEELTVGQNINAGALGRRSLLWAFRNLIGPLEANSCISLMQLVGLHQDLLNAPVTQISGGQRQRVALARLLRQQPQLVLADEPLSALDPVIAEDVLSQLLNQPSCLISLHRPDLIHRFTRVIGLRDGALAIDAPTELVTSDQLTWLYRDL